MVSHKFTGLLADLLTGTALCLTLPASAEWLETADLVQHCGTYLEDPTSSGSAACVAFVQGVLAGRAPASASHRGVVQSPPPADGSDESFAARAARTRVGGHLRPRSRPEGADYCIGADVPAERLVRAVAQHLVGLAPTDADTSPEILVLNALIRTFPCNEP